MKNNLSKIMGERRLTAVAIVRDTKISRTTFRVIYYEEAENVKLSTLTKIWHYLNCSLLELVEYPPMREPRKKTNESEKIKRNHQGVA